MDSEGVGVGGVLLPGRRGLGAAFGAAMVVSLLAGQILSMLFHELSGHGMLSWKEWQDIRSTMPFQIMVEHCIGNLLLADGTAVPSSFIWHLGPI